MLIFRYDTQWYRVPLREQKLMLFILHRSMQSCKLITGGIFVLSLEGFTTVNNDYHDVLTRFLTVTLIYLIAASCHIDILFYSIIIYSVVIAIIAKIKLLVRYFFRIPLKDHIPLALSTNRLFLHGKYFTRSVN